MQKNFFSYFLVFSLLLINIGFVQYFGSKERTILKAYVLEEIDQTTNKSFAWITNQPVYIKYRSNTKVDEVKVQLTLQKNICQNFFEVFYSQLENNSNSPVTPPKQATKLSKNRFLLKFTPSKDASTYLEVKLRSEEVCVNNNNDTRVLVAKLSRLKNVT